MSEEAQPVEPRQWPLKLKLKHPIEFGKETIAELTFQRGKMAFLKGVPIDGVPSLEQTLLMAARLCGQPTAVLEQLDPDDCPEVLAIAMDFFARCLSAGRGPSQR